MKDFKRRALLSAWHGAFGSVPTTAKEAVARANSVLRDENGEEVPHDPILREILQDHFADDRRGGISARYLGEFLKKFKGRIENGARFEKHGDFRRAIQWRVFITNKTRFSCESCESCESVSPQDAKNHISTFAQPPAKPPAKPPAYSHFEQGETDSQDSQDSHAESPLAPFLQKIARAYPPTDPAPVPVDQPAATAAAADPLATRIAELEALGWAPWNAKAKAEGEAREARRAQADL